MKFVIVGSGATLWSNDGSSVGGGQPTASVSVPVQAGLFTVRLGGAPMVPLTSAAMAVTGDVSLRVWVSTGGPFEQLSDQPISSAPYSLLSQEATSGGELWSSSGGNIHRVNGNVGIGTTTPGFKLDVVGGIQITRQGSGQILLSLNTEREWQFRQKSTGQASALELRSVGGGGNKDFYVTTDGEMIVQSSSGSGGRIETGVLEITGGADLAEPFDVLAGDGPTIEPGMVVSIDPERPGQLMLADRPYDTRVVGVISGANDLKPGLVLRSQGSAADGTHPVALSGRVWCRADATQSPIRPGDMLTTSEVPGIAKKARDGRKAPGAVLGKAMTGLERGRGLVLVLVSLQ